MMGMIEELEKAYGNDFMPRFLQLTRALKASQCPTLQEVLAYFGLVAGRDLRPWYHDLGITYAPPALPPDEVIQAKLTAYRVRLKQHTAR